MNSRAWSSPSRYIQGPGEAERLGEHIQNYGDRGFAVIDSFFYPTYSSRFSKMFAEKGMAFAPFRYENEVTYALIDAAEAQARAFDANVVVGMGGGKALDTAKAVANRLRVPLVVIPTSASTDAPTSAMSIYYNERHEKIGYEYFSKNPDLVLVDSQIIADAPPRFLAAGMGDALATVFEARASQKTDSPNYVCTDTGTYQGTDSAMLLAEGAYQILLRDGSAALQDNRRHQVTEALQRVIEANTLMSGIGFENIGCAAAHSIYNGLSCMEGTKPMLHGEMVAFGVLCELFFEAAPQEQIETVAAFLHSVGLPLTLAEMGFDNSAETISSIVRHTEQTEWTREPGVVTDETAAHAIAQADAYGQAFLSRVIVP
ncbi:MAG: glycerol dehydrogenase [Clostridiales bacterium]|nr:glycerol dehydrogenase [Clostridiales bacterium]